MPKRKPDTHQSGTNQAVTQPPLLDILLDITESNNTEAVAERHGRRLIAFGWYGGKYSHLEWLLPLLPISHHYCEPFGGSGAVLFNRQPSPVETYNDIDGANTFAKNEGGKK